MRLTLMSMATTPHRLRLLLATPRDFPYTGGIETHVHEVGRRLAGAGAEVTILTTGLSGQLPPVDESEGMHIRRAHAWPARGEYVPKALTGVSEPTADANPTVATIICRPLMRL